jgi:hypothetical protein
MENQTHHHVIMDHEMVIDGVIFREKKDLIHIVTVGNDNDKSGGEPENKQELVHSRSIGDRVYTITQTTINGVLAGECLSTKMDESEAVAFGEDWEAKWKPSIGGQPDSGIGATIKNMLKFDKSNTQQ